MEKKTIDLKQVLGLVAEYDSDQCLISPDKPFELKTIKSVRPPKFLLKGMAKLGVFLGHKI